MFPTQLVKGCYLDVGLQVALQAEAIAKELTTEQQAVDANVTTERLNVHALL